MAVAITDPPEPANGWAFAISVFGFLGHLAWPLMFGWLAWLFRKPISNLIARMVKGKGLGFELNFSNLVLDTLTEIPMTESQLKTLSVPPTLANEDEPAEPTTPQGMADDGPKAPEGMGEAAATAEGIGEAAAQAPLSTFGDNPQPRDPAREFSHTMASLAAMVEIWKLRSTMERNKIGADDRVADVRRAWIKLESKVRLLLDRYQPEAGLTNIYEVATRLRNNKIISDHTFTNILRLYPLYNLAVNSPPEELTPEARDLYVETANNALWEVNAMIANVQPHQPTSPSNS